MKLAEKISQNKDYGVVEQDVAKRTEEFRRKKEELKRRVYEEELRRVEIETEQRSKELANMMRSKDEHLYKEQLRQAETKRREDEESLRNREKEIQAKLIEERRKKQSRRTEELRLRKEEEDARRRSVDAKIREEEARKKADEERVRAEQEARRRVEELKAKRDEEAKLKAEEERQRREEEVRQRVEAESRSRADQERRRQEEQLRLQREEFQRKDEERRKQEEQRRIDAEQKRKDDEERRIREAEERRRLEEEKRIREAEELRIRLEEEERDRVENEAKREIEERQRQEAEAVKRRADELQRERQEQIDKERIEKEARILDLLNKAEMLFTQGDLKAALVEAAKALVNDPKNPAARELERTIKSELGTLEPKKEEKPAAQPKRPARKRVMSAPRFVEGKKQKFYLSRSVISATIVGILVIGAVFVYRNRDRLFPKPVTFAIIPWTSSANIAEESILGASLSEEVAREFERQLHSGMMGYSSSYGLMHSTNDPARAIFSLGYPFILEGSLTRSAVGYNLSLRMIDSLGSVFWAQTFIKSEASLPELPAEIAAQVTKVVGANSVEGMASSPARSTSSTSAYLAYLRGLELMHRGTSESTIGALTLFRQAIGDDENFANAYASAAAAYLALSDRGWNTNDSILAAGKELAETAVKINARGSAGQLVLAKILTRRKEYGPALEHLEAGLKSSPANSELYVERGQLLLRSGKDKEALESLTRAYELNPRDENVLRALGFANQLSGTPAQATWFHQTAVFFSDDSTAYIAGPLADALMLDPAFSSRDSKRVGDAFEHRLAINPRSYHDLYRYARILQVTGNVPQGSAMFERAEKILREELQKNPKNTDILISLGLTLTRLGKFAEALSLAHKALELSKDDALVKYRAAEILSLQMYSEQRKKIDDKKKEEALNLLRDAVAREYNVVELSNADFYNLHELPEFRTAIGVGRQ